MPAMVAGTIANRVTLTRSMIGTWLNSTNGSGMPVSTPATRSCVPIDTTSHTSAEIAAARAATLRHSSTVDTMIRSRPTGPKNVLSSVALTLNCRATAPLPASDWRANAPSESRSVAYLPGSNGWPW
jgi:hypothetical protein